MRVLVYPHELVVGGCPINAVDLAAAVVDAGHEAVVYGVPGPLTEYIATKGLPFVAAHPLKYRPAPTRMVQLARLVRQRRIDVIHAYEWPPCLDAYLLSHLVDGVPLVCTVLSMAVSPLVPGSVPLIVGTPQMQRAARRHRSGPVNVLEPQVDTDSDHPSVDGSAFRTQFGVRDDEFLVVTVCRLSIEDKLDALVRAVDATAAIAERLGVRLVIVGSGPAEAHLRARAAIVNHRLGREVVTMAGSMLDPRPAYAAADVVVAMGSSALRAMAFAKPVVVQGERGFSLAVEPATLDQFLQEGFFGAGDGLPGPGALTGQVEALLRDASRRRELGRFGRETIVERFSLQSAAAAVLDVYHSALASPPRRRTVAREALRVTGRAASNEFRLHLPSDKRARRETETTLLAAAASGVPPAGPESAREYHRSRDAARARGSS